MSYRALLFGGIAVLLVALAGTAKAEPGPRDMSFEGGLGVGLFIPSDEHELYDPTDPNVTHESLGTAFEIAARAGFMIKKFVGVEGELDFIPLSGDNASATALGVRVHVIGQLPSRIAPFAIAGVGILQASSDELGDDTDPMAYLGAGVKYYINDKIVGRADLRFIRAPKFEAVVEDKGTNHLEFLVGISFQFGGGEDEAEPVIDPDPDGDGFKGQADLCPNEAGVDPDGCPPKAVDSDGDGINDPDDGCPNEPETVNSFKDEDGCPDEVPDSDGDGLNDNDDKCPQEPEDMDGFEDDNGCPDTDNDNDGVTDDQDRCPAEPGPVENRGCPDTDQDGDGVVDRIDNCPTEPGTAENFGCKKKQLVQITTTQIKIMDKVYFRTGKAKIRSKSRKLLNNVADVLMAHGEIKLVRIEGHTDSDGDDQMNKELSQARAEAVRDYMIKRGVDADRLEAVGFGEEKPIGDNSTKDGKAANRRVEFNIVDQ